MTSHAISIMWDEIQDMPGEIFDFDDLIEEMCQDPEFIADVQRNNDEWDREASEHLDVTVEELHTMIGLGHAWPLY